jgi:peptidoglycan hydrolase-like protein with peptidoglycan-binding domain
MAESIVPQDIVVHLGLPGDSAQNVTIPFAEYIKNVASSEIYPTFAEQALLANIYAQISFALNRVYTNHYRQQGYDFDITNSGAIDQEFVLGRNIYTNVSRIVDGIFNDYMVMGLSPEPFLAEYCDGITTLCNGLSKWGSVSLAQEGKTALEILRIYYGDNIRLIKNAKVGNVIPTYKNVPLKLGSTGEDVRLMQIFLNRISLNYDIIPKTLPDGDFGEITQSAVKLFQEIFNLEPTGIIDKATWYKISYINFAIKRLAELESEGMTLSNISKQYSGLLKLGSEGDAILNLTHLLRVVALFNPLVRNIPLSDVFDEEVQRGVVSFQKAYNLDPDGIVGRITYSTLYQVYRGILLSIPETQTAVVLFPGNTLRLGSKGFDVRIIQEYLNLISETYPKISKLVEDGIYGPKTRNSVAIFQSLFSLPPRGIVGPLTWDKIASVYSDLKSAFIVRDFQFPGLNLS